MHAFPLSRRKFLTLSGAALAARALPAFADGLPPVDPLKDVKPAATAVNAFATDLYQRLAGARASRRATSSSRRSASRPRSR